MGKAVASQHPAVVLRSQYALVRALLTIAAIAVVGLTIAVVILATNGDERSAASTASTARPVEPIRYGGFNPATGRPEGPLQSGVGSGGDGGQGTGAPQPLGGPRP